VSLPLHWAQGTLTVWATALEGTDKVSAWTGSALKTPSPCSDVSGTMSIAAAAAAKASGFSCMVGRRVRVATGGAPPSPALLARMAELDLDVTHLYGLTETYGPAAICDWKPQWDDLDTAEQARLKSRQGVANLVSLPLRVLDKAGADVPADGEQVGEVVLRGNNVMLGYYRDEEATAAADADGWFRTGDMAVVHPDGYVELKDRSKDVIISGGENIASIEVEQALDSHPAVLESAVVAAPDERWGETVAAFVVLRPGATATEQELVEHVRSRIARFKAPKQVHFGELPKTGTGKIQKFVLRERLQGG